jgi:hypothetical protein
MNDNFGFTFVFIGLTVAGALSGAAVVGFIWLLVRYL